MGDKIKIVPHTEVFTDSEIVMRVIGYNHYKLSDGSGEFAGVVFDMVGVMNSKQAMVTDGSGTSGGWPVTNIRSYLNDIVYPELPQNWKTLIKEVEVLSSIGDLMPDIVSSNDKLFLLSAAELDSANSAEVPYCNEIDPDSEEITFSVFTDNSSRIKKTYNNTGSADRTYHRYTRSPSTLQNMSVLVNFNGALIYTNVSYHGDGYSRQISFVFNM